METIFELGAKIAYDDSELTSGVKGSESAFSGLSAKTVAMGQMMADAIEAVATKVVDFGKQIVSVGEEQESALAKVNTIMDTTQMTTEEMSGAIKELSSEMGISVSDLSDSVYNIISATGDTANAVSLAEQASKLATAGFTDTASAVSTLTTAMNAYGLSAEDASHISDSLITVQNLGVTTVGELSASMGKAIASASAYGVDLENLESAYISITKAGINTAEGTTYISSMLKELGDSSTDVAKILQEQTGMAFNEFLAEGNTLGDALGILNESVDGDATALMNLWSSAEAGKASSAIVGQGLENFNANLETLQTTTGTTESAFETMADTLEHKVSVFQTVGQNLMSSLYDGMSGSLGDIVEFGSDMITQLSDAFEEGGLDSLAFAIGDVMMQAVEKIGEYIPDIINIGGQLIVGLVEGFAETSDIIGTGAMDIVNTLVDSLISDAPNIIQCGFIILSELATSIGESLPTLIPAIADLMVTIVQAFIENAPMLAEGAVSLIEGLAEGLMEALPVLIEALPELISTWIEAFTGNISTIIEGVVSLVNMVVENLPTIMQALIDALPTIIQSVVDGLITNLPILITGLITLVTTLAEALPEITMALIEAIPQILDAIVEGFAPLTSMLGDFFSQLWDDIKQKFSEFGESLNETIQNIITWFTRLPENIAYLLGSAIGTFRTWISNMISEAPKVGTNVIQAIVKFFSELPSKIATVFSTVLNKLIAWISNMAQTISARIPQMVSNFITFWKELPSKIMEVGKNVIQGLWDGIKEKWTSFIEDIQQKVDKIKELFTIGFDTHSPSKWFKWLGEMNIEGFRQGMDDLLNPTGIANDIRDSLATVSATPLSIDVNSASALGTSNQQITVVLQGDAQRIFRLVQEQSSKNVRLTGQPSFA